MIVRFDRRTTARYTEIPRRGAAGESTVPKYSRHRVTRLVSIRLDNIALGVCRARTNSRIRGIAERARCSSSSNSRDAQAARNKAGRRAGEGEGGEGGGRKGRGPLKSYGDVNEDVFPRGSERRVRPGAA